MARGPKKHQKRIATPKSWMLGKLGGIYAKRPSQGPHKLRESIPIQLLLKHKLGYANTSRECTAICQDKEINFKIDGKVRRDIGFPIGIMDNISIEKTGENFRVWFDVKGRVVLRPIKEEEAKYKLLKIKEKALGPNKVPYITTHDARTIRYPHPEVNIGDTIKYDLNTKKITDWSKFDINQTVFITSGNNIGRVGVIQYIERHPGSFDIVHIKDANGKAFATRSGNVFIIGKGKDIWVTIKKDEGQYFTALEERKRRGSL